MQYVTPQCYWDLPLLQTAHPRAGPITVEQCLLSFMGMRSGQRATVPAGTISALHCVCVCAKPKLSNGKRGTTPFLTKKCVVPLFSWAWGACSKRSLLPMTSFLCYSHTLLSRCAALCHFLVAYNVSESRSLAFLIRHSAILPSPPFFFFNHSEMKV